MPGREWGAWALALTLILGPLPGSVRDPCCSGVLPGMAKASQEGSAPLAGVPASEVGPAPSPMSLSWWTAWPQAPMFSPPETPARGVPLRITVPVIGLDAPVRVAPSRIVLIAGRRYREWLAPDAPAAGWIPTSARVGEIGNLVLNGHHNIAGAVFRHLVDLPLGARIRIDAVGGAREYEIVERRILPERDQPLAVRESNARWIQATAEERLTLVTCWPPWSNSHRLILIAHPLPSSGPHGVWLAP
jgi:LPXTG-site transpeptidase (sortase) family protein